jgi:hypothetical protein
VSVQSSAREHSEPIFEQRSPATRILHIYLWLTMSLLFIQGSGSLLLRLRPDIEAVMPWILATLMNGNIPHAILHIVWGAVGLTILITQHSNRVRLGLGLTFGVFYTLLGFLGIVTHNPFGLRLAWEENAFHLTVGPLMLLLVWLAWRSKDSSLAALGNPKVS